MMASTPSSSSFAAGINNLSPRNTEATALARPRKSTAPEFGTPIRLDSSSPYRTPTSSSKAAAFLAKTPFGTPNRAALPPSSTPLSTSTVQSNVSPAQPLKPLTGRAQLTARIRSLWMGGDTAASVLQAKGYLPYTGLAKLMLQTNFDRLYFFSVLAIHVFLCISLFAPLQPISSFLLPLRPSVLLLSTLAFCSSILPLILLRRTEISSTSLASKSQMYPTQDISIAGATLRYGSPAAHYFGILTLPRTGLTVALYALSGLFLAAFQAIALMLYSSDPNAWLPYQTVSFRNPQGLRVSSLRPNERLYFLLGSNLVLGALYTLHRSLSLTPSMCDLASSHSAVVFEPQSTFVSLGARLSGKMRQRLPRALLIGSTIPSLLLAFYMTLRRPLFRLILSVIGHNSALRPILIPSFRHHFLSLDLVFRTTILGLSSALTWETFNVIWEVLATQPFTDLPGGLSRFSREPTKCLIEGLQSRRALRSKDNEMGPQEQHHLAHFAFAEISMVAATDYERRRSIFREVGSSHANAVDAGSKSAWVLIAQECIKVLQEERLCLTSKGKQSTMAATNKTQPSAGLQFKAFDRSHQALVESGTDVLQKRPVSVWDKLASQSTTPAAPPTAPAAAIRTSTSSSNDLSAIMHRLAPPPAAAQNQVAKAPPSTAKTQQMATPASAFSTLATILLSAIASAFQTVYAILPPDVRHVLSRLPFVTLFISANHKLLTPTNRTLLCTGAIPLQTALTTWSIQTLSALLSASVDQDEYGTVALSSQQRLGVDDVLEEIASLLLELKQWGQAIAAEMQAESDASKQQLTMLWDRRVAPMVNASRNAIQLVVGVFEPTDYTVRQSTRDKIDKAMAM